LDDAPLNLERLLTTVRETAYRLNFSNRPHRLGGQCRSGAVVAGADKIDRGRAFALLVDPE